MCDLCPAVSANPWQREQTKRYRLRTTCDLPRYLPHYNLWTVWFIIYQIISDIIVLIKRYPTVETKHSTSFQCRYSPIKRAVNCGLLSLRQGSSWFLRQYGNCLHERDGAGAASQRILLELPMLIGAPRVPG